MKKMTCKDVADFLGDYIAGVLAGDLRDVFDDHLGRCGNCQRFLAQYRDTISVGRDAFVDPEADAATEVPEDLVRAILSARK
jgi:hypothetical protein